MTTTSVPDVAFITVNYNTRHYLEAFFSFFRNNRLPFSHTLVVVDNGSTDGSRELLARTPELVYLPMETNCGYGTAINRGLAAVKSRYVVVMNTDIELTAPSLARLWEFMESSPDADWAAPLITSANGRQQGFIFHPSLLSLYWIRKSTVTSSWYKLQGKLKEQPFAVPGLMGAFFWLRRSSVPESDRGQLFDEQFFFYYEDADLAYRLWQRGCRAYVVPDAATVHYGGGSSSLGALTYFMKSRFLFIEKHYGKSHAAAIQALDRFRIWRKFTQYRCLTRFFRTERFLSKLEKYRTELKIYREAPYAK